MSISSTTLNLLNPYASGFTGAEERSTEESASIDQTVQLSDFKLYTSIKAAQKALIKTKFIVGQHYALRTKGKDGFKSTEKVFECKKFIYTINDMPVNVVIMKQLKGQRETIFTLNKHDCALYHIKYEPGLQVWPMQMKWIKIRQKENI